MVVINYSATQIIIINHQKCLLMTRSLSRVSKIFLLVPKIVVIRLLQFKILMIRLLLFFIDYMIISYEIFYICMFSFIYYILYV